MKKIQKLLIAVAIVMYCCIGAASAQIYVNVRPPRPVIVRPVPPTPTHVWVDEDWEWRDGRYQWVGGRWEEPRAGYIYRPGRWRHSSHGHHWDEGHWVRGEGHGEHRHDHGHGHGHGHDRD